jgi:hypothetical protein
VVENEMKINPGKSKAPGLTMAQVVKEPLNFSFKDQRIPEASCCKYLGIIIRSDLSWADKGKLHGAKSLEGTTFDNAYSQKGK